MVIRSLRNEKGCFHLFSFCDFWMFGCFREAEWNRAFNYSDDLSFLTACLARTGGIVIFLRPFFVISYCSCWFFFMGILFAICAKSDWIRS